MPARREPEAGTTGGGAAPAGDRLAGRRIVVGVAGGISAYKTAELVSRLVQRGCDVTVVMTRAARRFVTPLTFEALSGRGVVTDWAREPGDPQHVALAHSAHAAVVAPCTMQCMAKLAHGFADDAVSLMVAAIDRKRAPVLLAPAMNSVMWSQPGTARNAARLREDGFVLVGPGEGWQACRTVGAGRMAEPDEIFRALEAALAAGAR